MTKNTNEIIRYDIDEDTGIWSGKDKHLRGHMEDEKLKQAALDIFNKKNVTNVYDFGCGLGGYTKFFNEHGIHLSLIHISEPTRPY